MFLLASALLCAGAGVALGSILSHSLTREALNAEEASLAQYVDGVVHPVLVHHDRVVVPWREDGQLAKSHDATRHRLPELFGVDPLADELVPV